MTAEFKPVPALSAESKYLQISQSGNLLHIRLNRAEKRNAVNDAMVAELRGCFRDLPDDVRCVLISGEGQHFCGGLDLSEVTERDSMQAMAYIRRGHAAFDDIQFGHVPVIAVLHGAVIGAGMELASTCHLRVAESSAYFALPEAQRGIFVGGSGSVRIPRLIGVSRMTDMMLTGRVLDAAEAERIGLVNYVVPDGEGFSRALVLAQKIASNVAMSNVAVIQGLPHIAEQGHDAGLFTEALLGTLTQQSPETRGRLADFLAKRAGKVVKGGGTG